MKIWTIRATTKKAAAEAIRKEYAGQIWTAHLERVNYNTFKVTVRILES